jgi:hypothetical protein
MQQGHWQFEMKSREARVAAGAARRMVAGEAKVWSSRAGSVAVAVRARHLRPRSFEPGQGSSAVAAQRAVAPNSRPAAVSALPRSYQSTVHRVAAVGAFVDYALHNHSLQRTASPPAELKRYAAGPLAV